MSEILEIVKIVALTLLTLILFFILLVLFAKYYFIYRQKQEIKKTDFIWNVLNCHFRQKKPLKPEMSKKLQKYIPQLLVVLSDFEKIHRDESYLNSFKAELTESVLKPAAGKWVLSYQWVKRFYATQCYAYGFDLEDRKKIARLLRDKMLLISINMASEIVKKQDPFLINEVITVFSSGRRLQQSSFAEILTRDYPDISDILKERLGKEKECYVKIFCYRLLSKMPKSKATPVALKDLNSDSIDLKISALDYLIHSKTQVKKEIISKLIKDPNWEVRASAARALGDISGEKSLEQLAFLMKDEAWWVRINAANSLSRQGEPGFNILKKLSPDEDRFAYETAQSILRVQEAHDG